MANDIVVPNRGLGTWLFEIYNPNKIIGPFTGYLYITTAHHIIFKDAKLTETIINIPSQNVAYVKKEQ